MAELGTPLPWAAQASGGLKSFAGNGEKDPVPELSCGQKAAGQSCCSRGGAGACNETTQRCARSGTGRRRRALRRGCQQPALCCLGILRLLWNIGKSRFGNKTDPFRKGFGNLQEAPHFVCVISVCLSLRSFDRPPLSCNYHYKLHMQHTDGEQKFDQLSLCWWRLMDDPSWDTQGGTGII